VAHLLAAAADADDRVLQHSIAFALIELERPQETRAGLASNSPRTVAASLLALDQMPGDVIGADDVIPFLGSSDDASRQAALWVAARHVEWGGALSDWFRQQLATSAETSPPASEEEDDHPLARMLTQFATNAAIQELIAETVVRPDASNAARQIALRAMTDAGIREAPESWRTALAKIIESSEQEMLTLAIGAARKLPLVPSPDDPLNEALLAAAKSSQSPDELRVAAAAAISQSLPELPEPLFELLLGSLDVENEVAMRSAAADALSQARLTPPQLERLCEELKSVGPLELNRLIAAFREVQDQELTLRLLSSLKETQSLASLRIDILREAVADNGPAVQQGIAELESLVNVDAAAQRERIEELLIEMRQGDVRRGHAVFHSAKAACTACHRLGYAGGKVGPDLSRIGEIRTERDLLESILYPSLSFVRSYEPVLIITVDGRTVNGNVIEETAEEYVVATDADHQVRLDRQDVEEIHPSKVSTMPSGLDQQLTTQQLADLVAFLKSARD
jgi:putative heme-binding domain-containing protein